MAGNPFALPRSMIAAALALLFLRSSLFGGSPFGDFPRTVIWAWERPEDLRFLAGRDAGVAFLAATVRLSGDAAHVVRRRQPLLVDETTPVMAVVRVEISRGRRAALSGSQREAVVAAALSAARLPRVSAVQIDGDATLSERKFFRAVLTELRGRLDQRLGLSFTALASWCVGDRWLEALRVDEVVPMLFQMGPDAAAIRARATADGFATECRAATGLATDEPFVRTFGRVYLFSAVGWTEPRFEAAGELGVLQPTWIRAYLVVSYRYLAGIPLGPGEQAAALAYWKGQEPGSPGADAWMATREAATGAKGPGVAKDRWVGYSSYLNCGDDAFQRAAKTLQSYVGRYGKDSPETRGWLAAQETVFANCSDEKPSFPEYLPASAPAPLRADRAYQLASASFYAGRLELAQKGFEEIANDASSPWREIAPYLAARAVLRQATLGSGEKTDYLRLLAEARARFIAVRDGAKTPELRRWSEDLLRFVELHLEPDSHVASAAARVLKPQDEAEFAVSFVHYRDLLARVLGLGPGDPQGERYVPDPQDDLTSWIVAFQTKGPSGLDRALEGWTRTRANHWLAAVVAKISPDHPRYAEIAEAVRRLPRNAPGRVHFAYHLADLETKAGRRAEARKIVAETIAKAQAAGSSATNLFLDLELRNATTFEEFILAAPRRAAYLYGEIAGKEDLFDEAGQTVLNTWFPLDRLVRFFEESSLEPVAREKLRKVVLTRAILLGRLDVAQRMAALVNGAPRLGGPEWRVDAALAVLLEDSQMRPYVVLDADFSIAWWCSAPVQKPPVPPPPVPPPSFLTAAEREEAAKEVDAFVKEGAAATWFCREALAFTKRHPDDPRAPEFLARAVRATREGCADAQTRALSKAAFEHLHRRYPRSPFAKQTTYWFEGRGWYPPS